MDPANDDYALLARQLAELVDAAREGDIERIERLGGAQEDMLKRIKAAGEDLRKHPDARLLATHIADALKSIKAATPYLEALRDKAQTDATGTRMHRKVSQSYR